MALVAPPATVTVAGTVAAAVMLLDKVKVRPPAGATAVKVTVPVEVLPPMTEVGLSVSVESATALTRRLAVLLTPLKDAVMTTFVVVVIGTVVMAKVAVVLPAAIVTVAATLATVGLALDRETAIPPVGAAALRVTVPVEV